MNPFSTIHLLEKKHWQKSQKTLYAFQDHPSGDFGVHLWAGFDSRIDKVDYSVSWDLDSVFCQPSGHFDSIVTCNEMGPFLYSMATKERLFILDTEVENGKYQPCIIRLLTFYLLSAKKRLSSRYLNFQLLEMLFWRMSGTFPHRDSNLVQC